jgi:hypothetical protein
MDEAIGVRTESLLLSYDLPGPGEEYCDGLRRMPHGAACSMVATYEHADSTSFSNRLQLMGKGANLGEPGRYGPSNPGLMAPEELGMKPRHPEPRSQKHHHRPSQC